jgi:hypothetical protein
MGFTNTAKSRAILAHLAQQSAADYAAAYGLTEAAAEKELNYGRDMTGATGTIDLVVPLCLPTEGHVRRFENALCAHCRPQNVGAFGCKIYTRAIAGNWKDWLAAAGRAYCRGFTSTATAEAIAKARKEAPCS